MLRGRGRRNVKEKKESALQKLSKVFQCPRCSCAMQDASLCTKCSDLRCQEHCVANRIRISTGNPNRQQAIEGEKCRLCKFPVLHCRWMPDIVAKLESLKVERPSLSGSELQESFSSSFECLICMEQIGDCHLCPKCSQMYCLRCLRRWLSNDPACPHCKAEIRFRDLAKCRWIDAAITRTRELSLLPVVEDEPAVEQWLPVVEDEPAVEQLEHVEIRNTRRVQRHYYQRGSNRVQHRGNSDFDSPTEFEINAMLTALYNRLVLAYLLHSLNQLVENRRPNRLVGQQLAELQAALYGQHRRRQQSGEWPWLPLDFDWGAAVPFAPAESTFRRLVKKYAIRVLICIGVLALALRFGLSTAEPQEVKLQQRQQGNSA